MSDPATDNANRRTAKLQARVGKAVRLIERFGSFDGEHHKQWVLDQVLRALLGAKGYRAWVVDMNADTDYSPWDEGIAP